MFHKSHPIPKAIALVIAVLIMIPVAKEWHTMAGALIDAFIK